MNFRPSSIPCDDKTCNFFNGIFCGICEAPSNVANLSATKYNVHSTQRTHGAWLPNEFRFECHSSSTADSVLVQYGAVITAHVRLGTDHVLVKAGESFEGVSVSPTDHKVQLTAAARNKEVLVPVTPPAGSTKLVVMPVYTPPPPSPVGTAGAAAALASSCGVALALAMSAVLV